MQIRTEFNSKIQTIFDKHSWLVIPDLHGSRFSDLAAQFATEFAQNIIQLGDVIDVRTDGSSGIKSLDAMIMLKKARPDAIFLRGNHEQKFLKNMESFRNGQSLQLAEGDTLLELVKKFHRIDLIPSAYLSFISDTVIYHETKALLFMHGGVTRAKASSSVSELTELEMLESYDVSPFWKGKKIVRGHKPVNIPEEWSNHINTDAFGWMPNRPLRLSIVTDVLGHLNLLGWIEISGKPPTFVRA